MLELKKALNQEEEIFEEYRKLFDQHMKKADYKAAVQVKKEQINIKPDDFDLKLELIDAFSKLGDFEESVNVRFELASKYFEKRQFMEAAQMLEGITEVQPSNTHALKMMAEAYNKVGEEKKALECFLKLSKHLDTDEKMAYIREARC